jgi:alginate O-acetyltransferase complex protein AlgI
LGFIATNLSGIQQGSQVHLPLGISYFTLQGISHLTDVYRKQAKIESNIFNLT